MNMLPRINPLPTLLNTAQQQEEIKCRISKENLSSAEVSQWNQPQAQHHSNTRGVFALKLLVQPPWPQVVTNVCVKPLLHSVSKGKESWWISLVVVLTVLPSQLACKDTPSPQPHKQPQADQPPLHVCEVLTVWQAGFTPWAAAEARLPDGIACRCFTERKMTSLIDE